MDEFSRNRPVSCTNIIKLTIGWVFHKSVQLMPRKFVNKGKAFFNLQTRKRIIRSWSICQRSTLTPIIRERLAFLKLISLFDVRTLLMEHIVWAYGYANKIWFQFCLIIAILYGHILYCHIIWPINGQYHMIRMNFVRNAILRMSVNTPILILNPIWIFFCEF